MAGAMPSRALGQRLCCGRWRHRAPWCELIGDRGVEQSQVAHGTPFDCLCFVVVRHTHSHGTNNTSNVGDVGVLKISYLFLPPAESVERKMYEIPATRVGKVTIVVVCRMTVSYMDTKKLQCSSRSK